MLVDIAIFTLKVVGALLVVYFIATIAFEIVFRLLQQMWRD